MLYVNPGTGNDSAAGSQSAPFKTLTRALKVAKDGTAIQLAAGNYTAAGGEVFPLVVPVGVTVLSNAAKGKGVVISGGGEYASPTFGSQNITLRLLDRSQIVGVTITNRAARGTGVWIESTAPTLTNNTFINCGREGVFVSGRAKPAIFDNSFSQNAAAGLTMTINAKGEVRRNLFQKTGVGIAIASQSAPLVADNQLLENRTGILLSGSATPVLRNNGIEKNTQGVVVNGNAAPDLGSTQDAANNILRDNGVDLENATPNELISAGNQINPSRTKGAIQFVSVTIATPSLTIKTDFSDMSGHWAIAFVQGLVSKGFISGFPDGTFKPEAPITRAQYAAVLAKTFNLPQVKNLRSFTDVKTEFWAASAIAKSAAMGFISGFPDGTFRAGQNLTRIQAIASVVNGLKLTGGNPDILSLYSDRVQIPSYATNATATATAKRLIVNYPHLDQLQPLRDITRAEVAALIYQALVATGVAIAVASPYIVS